MIGTTDWLAAARDGRIVSGPLQVTGLLTVETPEKLMLDNFTD